MVFLRLTYLAVNLPPTTTRIVMVMPWWFMGTNCTVRTNSALLESQVRRYDVLLVGTFNPPFTYVVMTYKIYL